ncbi:MAG TPA: peptide chain release factor 2 [Deltaproteobacteria bacterium]|nr:peptide chain release factor 2 [Deltaproteobacteria bacterium]HCY10588.1 peptide chain release factor 2 [Deltaproteobacteria bacterium]
MFEELKEELQAVKGKFEDLRSFLDQAAKVDELDEIDARLSDPTVWSDQEEAQKLTRRKAELTSGMGSIGRIGSLVEDAEVLLELADEAHDEAVSKEAGEKLKEARAAIRKAEIQRMLSGEHDRSNAIVSIHPGAGGTEAQDWADILLRMYLRWAESRGYKAEVVDFQPGDEAGVKSVTFTLSGEYAYGYMKAEGGVHRLVRISPFDANKRRHTSFASVFVYPEIEEDVEVDINDVDLRVDTFRASGAGGQHVNKTDSAVRITHMPTGIVVQCQNERSQHKNRAFAMKLLRARLYELKLKEQEAKMQEFAKDKREIAWGSQIRSYVMQPYRLIKDHRTGFEVGNIDPVLDGDLDQFIEAYLQMLSGVGAK